MRGDASTTSRFAGLDNLGSVSGDSAADTTVEQHDQTAITTSPQVPTEPAQDPAQEAVARPEPPDEHPVFAETNGHPDSNGHGPDAEPAAIDPVVDQATVVEDAPAEPGSVEAAADAAVTDAPAEPSADRRPPPITPDVEQPAFGPRILGVAEPVKPLPSKKAAAPARKRRRRPSAAERHRRAFFAALTDLRRGGSETEPVPAPEAAEEAQPPVTVEVPQAAATPEPTAATSAEPEALQPESPAEPEAPAAPEIPLEPDAVQSATPAEPEAVQPESPVEPDAPAAREKPARPDDSDASPARLAAAIERVGGPEVIKEALKPKQDEKGQPLKWAAVCAQAAEGLKPGDPVFNAWVRLAATPVREVKGHLPRPAENARPAGREGGRRNGPQRPGEGGRRDRPRRDDRPNRQEYASHAQDGTLRKSIRIVTGHDEDQERRERERVRKEQREAKRRAERERLARLGY